MKVILTVTAGPFQGKEFAFDGHDTFLVGRVNDAHLQLSYDDPYFSRRHFVVEVNPPRCRLMDLKSRNGTQVNGEKVSVAEINHGDVIKAGHTVFKVSIVSDPHEQPTKDPFATLAPERGPSRVSNDLVIPGYEILKEVGRGGMGVVYQGRRTSDGTPVAIKTIIPSQGSPAKQVDRFLREAEILQKLRHPNIVGFHESGFVEEMIFLAMEFVNGPDVGKVLEEKGPMPVSKGVRLICQMLSGLYHAHEEGFVHRDIKPSNILIHMDGNKRQAKLADFGLARAFTSSQLSGLTLQGEIGGTPMFMAPEQVTHYREVCPPADQFSAAATLYVLITGKCIHDLPPGLPHQLIHITTEEPVPIRARNREIPAGLAEVIHRALSREPKERYPDVEEFRAELKQWA